MRPHLMAMRAFGAGLQGGPAKASRDPLLAKARTLSIGLYAQADPEGTAADASLPSGQKRPAVVARTTFLPYPTLSPTIAMSAIQNLTRPYICSLTPSDICSLTPPDGVAALMPSLH